MPQEAKELLESITEYNFLVTDFIYHSQNDKELLRKFWDVLEVVAADKNKTKQLHGFQRGILTQVAACRLLEQCGFKPHLSHPTEDAFQAIDLWTDTAAVQVKGARASEQPDVVFYKTDSIVFPGIETMAQAEAYGKQYHMTGYYFYAMQRFHAKLSEYKKIHNKNVEGYYIVIPNEKIDFITGEPDAELVEQVKERIKTELK